MLASVAKEEIKDEDLSQNSIKENKLKFEKDNNIFSYGHNNKKIDFNNNYDDKKENFKTWGNYRTYRNKTHNNNCSSKTASKNLNSKNIINNSNIKKNKY